MGYMSQTFRDKSTGRPAHFDCCGGCHPAPYQTDVCLCLARLERDGTTGEIVFNCACPDLIEKWRLATAGCKATAVSPSRVDRFMQTIAKYECL
jgi:hypothetical protein